MNATNLQPEVGIKNDFLRAYLGRQPIFDRSRRLVGYELLYRSGDANRAEFPDGTSATSTVLVNSVLEFGIENVVNDATAWVNFPGPLLEDGFPIPVRPDKMVVELLEDVEPTDKLLGELRELVRTGYRLALDDCVYQPRLRPLLDLAHFVKIEVWNQSPEQIEKSVSSFRGLGVELVAEKVETLEQYRTCCKLGFDYFQGYYFCRPEILKKRRLPANHMALLRTLAELQLENTSLKQIAAIVQQDPALSFRLLRFLNSAYFNLPQRVACVEHAIALVGLREVRRVVTLLVLGRLTDRPHELVNTALTRARACEQLSHQEQGVNSDTMFLVGLLSVMDALLGISAIEVLELLPVTPLLERAILSREGPAGKLLAEVELHEQGRWDELERLIETDSSCVGLPALNSAWLEAVHWAHQVSRLTR